MAWQMKSPFHALLTSRWGNLLIVGLLGLLCYAYWTSSPYFSVKADSEGSYIKLLLSDNLLQSGGVLVKLPSPLYKAASESLHSTDAPAAKTDESTVEQKGFDEPARENGKPFEEPSEQQEDLTENGETQALLPEASEKEVLQEKGTETTSKIEFDEDFEENDNPETEVEKDQSLNETKEGADGTKRGVQTEIEKLTEKEEGESSTEEPAGSVEEVFECDYSNARYDHCVMKGDIQVHGSSFRLLSAKQATPKGTLTIKPYPRKQFPNDLATVSELTLESVEASVDEEELGCDVIHKAPGIVFSTAGLTGNYFHDMNEGWVSIFTTAFPFDREVVFIVSDLAFYWTDKYADLLLAMTKYPILDLMSNAKTHCFREVRLGLINHGSMAVDKALPPHIKLEQLGQRMAEVAGLPVYPTRVSGPVSRPLRLGWVHRAEGGRVVENEEEVRQAMRDLGFELVAISIDYNSGMRKTFEVHQSLDILMGLHGSGLSNFIFMRGNCVLIQLIPFDLWMWSDLYFGQGAQTSGYKYIHRQLSWEHSSLSREFTEDSEIHEHPELIATKYGYETWKKHYILANYTVPLDMVQEVLQEAKDFLLTPFEEAA